MSKFCFFPDFSDVFQIFVTFNSDQNRGIRQEQLHDEGVQVSQFSVVVTLTLSGTNLFSFSSVSFQHNFEGTAHSHKHIMRRNMC